MGHALLIHVATCVRRVHGLVDGGKRGVHVLVDGTAGQCELVEPLARAQRVGRELVDCAVRDDLAYALDGRDEDGDETPQRLGGF